MPVTVTIGDELANQLRPYESQVETILALGIREWQARNESGYAGLNSVLEMLAAMPTPEEVLALRPTPTLQARVDFLLEKNQTFGWTDDERREWDQYQYVEHLVRLAKGSAAAKLRGAKAG
ncbi:MAG: hypothetical protein HYR84_02440 [Planctomycetes bacterium]|nr:hypothetical protein [Planctomycetota bacterium]